MSWFRRKQEFPQHWNIGDHSGFICKSWKDVSYKMFIDMWERPEDTLSILTGATKKHLQDKEFRRKMESMTLWAQAPYKTSNKPEIIIESTPYVFPDDLNLLYYSTGQFHYIVTCMLPIHKIAEELNELQKADEKDVNRIQELTDKQLLEQAKLYPKLIACYIGIATGEEFTGHVDDDLIEKIWEVDCAQVLNLGAFFLTNSQELVSLKFNVISMQEYMKKSFLVIIRKRVMMISTMLGAYLYLLKAWLIDTVNSPKK